MSPRAFHAALVDLVKHDGSEEAKALTLAFYDFNAEFFDDKLGEPCVMVTNTRSPRALGDYIGQDPHGIESRIRISPAAVKRGLDFARDVLLHEMVHAWVKEEMGEDETGYKGHGPIFTAKCNAIGEALGLAKVFVKGRGGPNSARWPFCVREQEPTPPPPAKPPPAKPSLDDACDNVDESFGHAVLEGVSCLCPWCGKSSSAAG